MLLLADVDDDVVALRVAADDHALVDRNARPDEEAAAVLRVEQAVRRGFAGLMRDDGTGAALLDVALVRLVAFKHVVHDAVAVRIRQELRAVAHDAARRDLELEMRRAAVARAHVDELRLARAELLHNRADVAVRHLDHQKLDRLVFLAVDLLVDDVRAGNLEFVILAAHLLDEDREVQLAAAGNLEGVGRVRLLDAHRDVRLDLLEQAVADVARGDVLALAARKRGVVDHEQHRDGRLVDLDERQRLHMRGVAGRLADVEVRHAGDRDDVAERSAFRVDALEALELVELRDARVARFVARAAADRDGLADLHGAALDAADADAAHVVVVVDVREQHLRRAVEVALGRRNLADDRLEQRLHIGALFGRVVHRVAVARGGVDDRELELVLVRAELDEQVEHLVDDLQRARARAVDLVDDDDRLLAEAERLLEDEARLRHAALKCVDEQQNAVDHHQDALHLAAEIGVAGRIDDIDLHAVVHDGRIFRENGDAALALEVVRVHDALGDVLIAAENAALAQELVDQRRLAVVDMRDDRDVPEIFSFTHT